MQMSLTTGKHNMPFERQLLDLLDWNTGTEGLTRTYPFDDYLTGVNFVNQIGLLAEQHQHHPDILLTWRKVKVTLITHDAGNTITEKDTTLAELFDQAYHKEQP